MIKWLNLAGNEVESNDHPATIKALKDSGWKQVKESEQMEIEVDESPKKPKSKGNK